MDEHKYLILAEVDESPFLVLSDSPPPDDGFVVFDDGTGDRIGEIVMSCFLCMGDTDISIYNMFSALRPIFEAVKMYGCCYEKGGEADGTAPATHDDS